jgi:hypothetical protein
MDKVIRIVPGKIWPTRVYVIRSEERWIRNASGELQLEIAR